MNISATLLLIFGLVATTLFVGVFVAATIVTMRNRKFIRRRSSEEQ